MIMVVVAWAGSANLWLLSMFYVSGSVFSDDFVDGFSVPTLEGEDFSSLLRVAQLVAETELRI